MSDMISRDVTVPFLQPEGNLGEAVSLLRRSKRDALPVVDDEGYLIGIFTKVNVLDAYLSGADLSESIHRYFNHQVVTVEINTPYQEVDQRVKHTMILASKLTVFLQRYTKLLSVTVGRGM